MDDKKGIVVSITLLLLLVIAIIGTLMFQGWFFAFSSNIFVKTEDKGKESISLEALIGDSLFINNRDTANITIEEVTIAGKECSIKSVLTTGMNIISLETCNYNSALGIQDIVVRTQKNLYEKKFYSSINTLNTKTLNSFSDFQTGSFYAEGYYPVTLSPEGDILLSQAYVYSASSLLPSFFYKNNKFGVALGSNNLLYISSSSYLEESAGDAGVAVIDTQGTISPEDDLLLGIYNQSSTPALSIPEIYSLEYDDDNDLLYVGGFGIYNTNPYEGGVSVIDTQGTKTLSDDILLGNYNKDTSVALRSETVQGIFIDKINDILYLSTSYDYNTSYPGGYRNTSGVYAIDRMGTKTLSDDVLLGVYNEFSSPSLNGVNTMRVGMDYDNNLLFLPAVSVGGFTVIDTQGTKTVSDDTLAYKLRSSTSPVSITSHGVQDFEYDNTTGYLYLSSFQANLDHLNSGFYIIDTNKTSTPTDDHIVNYYAAGTTPALTGSFATQFERFGNKIYLNEYSNLLVIDTKGTDNQGDDEVSTYEGYGFEAYYYSGIFLDSGNSLLYKTTPFGMAVLNLGSSLYNAQGIYYSPVFDSISDPYTILSWDETKQLGQNVSFYSRIIDESLYFIENFSSFNLSQVGDLNAWGQSVSSINLDNGNLVFSNSLAGYYTPQLCCDHPAGS